MYLMQSLILTCVIIDYTFGDCAVARLKNHPGATIVTLNTSNRDAMKEQVYSSLIDLLQKN